MIIYKMEFKKVGKMGSQKVVTIPSKSNIKDGDWVKIERIEDEEIKKSGMKLMENL